MASQLQSNNRSKSVCSDSDSSCSRRHGRFLVQPLDPSPCNFRDPSPKPPLAPSPGPKVKVDSNVGVPERRPSRIVGRFEVTELLGGSPDEKENSSTGSSSVADLSIPVISQKLSTGSFSK
jgi:hypothetical protein